jgi:hypothetical protein
MASRSYKMIPVVLSVEFVVEAPTRGTVSLEADNMTAARTVEKAWGVLRLQTPGMHEHAAFNHKGFVQPGLTVQAEVRREQVQLTVVFDVIKRREISYENQVIWNMWTSENICNHFFTFDKRLLPIECYEGEDKRT